LHREPGRRIFLLSGTFLSNGAIMTLRLALVLLVVVVLGAGLIPAGIVLDRRLGGALIERSRDDLARASMVLENRLAALNDVRMMHAREIALIPEVATALAAGELDEALRLVTDAARYFQEDPVFVNGQGDVVAAAVLLPSDLLEATHGGEMPVALLSGEDGLHLVALAPVMGPDGWLGTVGGSTLFGEAEAGILAGLTRADVVLLASSGRVVGSTLPDEGAASLAAAVAAERPASTFGQVHEVVVNGSSSLVSAAPLGDGTALFARDVRGELAVLPALRRTALFTTGGALVFALLVGAVFAARLARPVSQLADAAEGFAAGRPEPPLARSGIVEVRQLSEAFHRMRRASEARLHELQERQARLSILQGELVQRERMAATGRLLAQLAHEIRTPVATVRNCLEVVRRRGRLEGEAAQFAEMAVDELLRMHELAERMLDPHRPRGGETREAAVVEVARETCRLVRAGAAPGEGPVTIVGSAEIRAAIAPDPLKQVLLNLVLNAREVSPDGAAVEMLIETAGDTVRIDVLDRGPGIPEEVLSRVFDPFYTTKTDTRGVGLGLYTAEGLVRAAGGVLRASNRTDGPGARFSIELPRAKEE
jgi:signal transduction histidine kinase